MAQNRIVKILLSISIIISMLNGQGIHVNDRKIDLPMFPVMVLPGEWVKIRDTEVEGTVKVTENLNEIEVQIAKKMRVRAPEKPGIYPITFANSRGNSITIKLVVLVTTTRIMDNELNGYKIGPYPLSKKSIYKKPIGFIEVTGENRNTLLTPHFKLGQFLCKQKSAYPKYLVLQANLLIKLEIILEKYNSSASNKADTFFIMSGYRTPYYNKAIKNVKFSRHIYGDASDFYVDTDNDGYTDDLDGNGKVDKKDMDVLKKIVDDIDNNKDYKSLFGGMGTYGANSRHGSFIHIDTRGYKARW